MCSCHGCRQVQLQCKRCSKVKTLDKVLYFILYFLNKEKPSRTRSKKKATGPKATAQSAERIMRQKQHTNSTRQTTTNSEQQNGAKPYEEGETTKTTATKSQYPPTPQRRPLNSKTEQVNRNWRFLTQTRN